MFRAVSPAKEKSPESVNTVLASPLWLFRYEVFYSQGKLYSVIMRSSVGHGSTVNFPRGSVVVAAVFPTDLPPGAKLSSGTGSGASVATLQFGICFVKTPPHPTSPSISQSTLPFDFYVNDEKMIALCHASDEGCEKPEFYFPRKARQLELSYM